MITSFDTPVLLLIFNRPDKTLKILEAISKVQPKYMYVVADGPRAGNAEDVVLCPATRALIAKKISWPAEVKTLFRDENLGCGEGPSSAITWFFSQVTEGIILEDDCIPNPSFFYFCSELLEYYRDEERVMHIGGTNFQPANKQYTASYYFSSVAHVWGWATWRRAWDKYNYIIRDRSDFIAAGQINRYHTDPKIIEYWSDIFYKTEGLEIDQAWDHQWTYTIWRNNGLTIIPAVNMISNIGYGANATHTKEPGNWSDVPTQELLQIQHPGAVVQDRAADEYTFYRYYAPPSPPFIMPPLWQRIKRKLKAIVQPGEKAIHAAIERTLSKRTSPRTKKYSLLFLKVDSIGDYVLVRNFIECLAKSEKYKAYSITLCGNERYKDLALRLDRQYIKKFIWLDYYRMYRDSRYRVSKYLKIYFSGFDVLVHPRFSRCVVSDGIVKHSGAKQKTGFEGDTSNLTKEDLSFNNKWYTQLIKVPEAMQFEFERNREFFKQLLHDVSINRPIISFQKKKETYVVICPGAQNEFRQWSPKNFAILCDLLGNNGVSRFIIAGSAADVALAAEIKQHAHQQFEDYTGKKNLDELIDIFAGAWLIITNDSGPMHIAFAMNKNVIGISNGHHYKRFSPYPPYMHMRGTCIYPKNIDAFKDVSARELLPNINTILPEDVYAIIAEKYLPEHDVIINHHH